MYQTLHTRTTITRSRDFERIYALPRRTWSAVQAQQAADYYTHILRTPNGTMKLRPLQGVAFHEMATVGGMLGPIRVGGGKTLLSLLAPKVLEAWNPILLLPASLIEKTKRAMAELMNHWQITRNIQFISYEMLGREGSARFFDKNTPDLIIADEAQRLKNLRAGVTRRVKRYMHSNPHTRFIAMSGTLAGTDGLEDYAHMAEWCLKQGAPVPLDKGQLQEWSECLSGSALNPLHKVEPGPLLSLSPGSFSAADDTLSQARKSFRSRLLETPGVVSSGDEHVSCSLYIRALCYSPNVATEANFRILRDAWEAPDGWSLSQAPEVWSLARQLAIGLHYEWQPRPPTDWYNARKAWAKFVREVLSHSKHLDTELQVKHACEQGLLRRDFFDPWNAIKDTFTPNSVPVWHDDTALNLCAKWAKDPGIVWTDHSFFGHELARRTGLAYFGEQGLDSRGNSLDALADAITAGRAPLQSIIASARANSTGRNLQAWSRNLLTAVPAGAPAIEQLLGRTHRDGQKADEVIADVLFACSEHADSLAKALLTAQQIEQTTGHQQKILLADITVPGELEINQWAQTSARWKESI